MAKKGVRFLDPFLTPPSWALLGPPGPDGPIRASPGQKGSDLAVIQGVPEPVPADNGPFWAPMGPKGPKRAYSGRPSEGLWARIGPYGPIWAGRAQEGPGGPSREGSKKGPKSVPLFWPFLGSLFEPKSTLFGPDLVQKWGPKRVKNGP